MAEAFASPGGWEYAKLGPNPRRKSGNRPSFQGDHDTRRIKGAAEFLPLEPVFDLKTASGARVGGW
jgi:hypothetical protein